MNKITNDLDEIRGHEFLPADIAAKIPALYSTDGDEDKTIYAKYFGILGLDGWRWYVLEWDGMEGEAFCFVTSPLCPQGEYGYTDLIELSELERGGVTLVERDLYFQGTTNDIRSGQKY